MSSYISGILIFLMVLSPLFIPIAVTVVSAIGDLRSRLKVANLRPTRAARAAAIVEIGTSPAPATG
jgi:hypothetical protein